MPLSLTVCSVRVWFGLVWFGFVWLKYPSLTVCSVRASVRAVESSVTVKEGEEARLECELLQGNPQPTLSWKKQVLIA